MPKPLLLVDGQAVTAVSMPANRITHVDATVSAPSKPNQPFAITMDAPIMLSRSSGTLDGKGEFKVTIGPSASKNLRGKVTGKISVPGLTDNAISVTFT